jgi:hypothetical protein
MVRISLLAVPLVLVSFAASCGGEKKEVLVPAAEVAPRTTPLQTVEAIAEQRCNHETSCNAIGPQGKFGSMDQCMQAMRADATQELAGNDCIDGVADRNLDACLGEISTRACGGLSGTIDQLRVHRACRTGAICLN